MNDYDVVKIEEPREEKYYETRIMEAKRKKDGREAVAKYLGFIEDEESVDFINNYNSHFSLFSQEHKILKLLADNKYVVDLYDKYSDYFLEPPEILFVMEKAEGISLQQYIKKYSPISRDHFYTFMVHFIDAISGIHNKGVIHRDLSDNNIFIKVGPGGKISDLKIFDFGVAYLRREGIRQMMATGPFAPPEALKNIFKKPQNSYDMYSVGVIMYQLLSGGTLPYRMANMTDLSNENTYRPLDRNDISRKTKDFIKKCLKYKPQERPYSIVDIKSEVYKETK